MPSPVTHFEIYGDEPAQLAEFYRNLFGWHLEKAPGVDYWRIQTDPTDASGFSGGLAARPIPETHSWVHYVTVSSVDEAASKVVRLGGQVVRPKTAVPKAGWCAAMADPEGNIFAVWQPDPLAMPLPEPEG